MDFFKTLYGESREFFEERKCGNTAYEIAHQPLMWRAFGDLLMEMKPRINGFMDGVGCLRDVRLILTGAGSSGFVGRVVAGFAAQALGIHGEAIHTTDIVSAPDMCFPAGTADRKTLLISFARSGNSPESVGAVQIARKKIKDLYEIAIVCDGHSKLAKISRESANGLVLVMPEGTNDKGFAMTSSVSTMILAGFAVMCRNEIDKISEGIKILSDTVTQSYFVDAVNAARECAAWGFERAWYLGSGPLSALVREGALKMMELTNGRVVAGFNAATEFRHGPKTVINPKTLTVHFISNNPFTAQYDLDLFNELYGQRDGNKVVALRNAATPLKSDLTVLYPAAEYGILADVAVGLKGLVFMQLLSMFTSLTLGVTTDNPSPSGLVNRVVQGVTVYPC
ncbi:MAG: SIS domain-containing protein [Defluviitaleaceae bacterium]|nr:SIS domain-containing protein [Defluviitaleaceae bacterium]